MTSGPMSCNFFLITNFNNGEIGRSGALSINRFEPDATIILVDDGSTDVDLQRRCYKDIKNLRFLSLGKDESYVYAVNYGMNAIIQELEARDLKRSIITIFDVDAELLEPVCEKFAHTFAGDDQIGAITVNLVDHVGRSTGNVSRYPHYIDIALGQRWSQIISAAKNGSLVHSCFMAVRPSVWTDVGPFDARFNFLAADLDWGIRMAAKGYRPQIIESVTAVHPGGGTGVNPAKRVLLWTASAGLIAAKHKLFTTTNRVPFVIIFILRIVLEIIIALGASLFQYRYRRIFLCRVAILEGFFKNGCYKVTSEAAWERFLKFSSAFHL
jgi:GT2 family glycosyltransferase